MTDTRPTAYRIGQLLAVGEIATGREHDPILTQQAVVWPAQMVATVAHGVTRAPALRNRWQSIMAELSDIPTTPQDETQVMLGYWHERGGYHRGEDMHRMRLAAAMTQEAWAEYLRVSVATVRHWEQHLRNVPEDRLEFARLKRETVLN